MAIQIIDGYQVNNEVALDSRFVVGSQSIYITKESITYKYAGLRVWDLNTSTAWIWNGTSWVQEAIVGSGINATAATINYMPKFNDTSGNLINSDIFNGVSNIGIGLTGSNLNLTQFGSLKGLQVAGNIGANGGFYGDGSNITHINASNIDNGSLSINRIYSANTFIDSTPFVLQSGVGNVVTWVKASTLTGTAENTNKINIVDESSSTTTHYLSFTIGTGNRVLNISASNLRYIPNTGQIQVLNGTVTIPTYSFINSTTTGMYYDGLLSFSNAGVKKMSVSTNGIAIYNTNGPQIQFNSSVGDRVLWSKNSDLYFRYDGTIPTGGLLSADYKMLHTGNLVIGANNGLTSTGTILTENLVIKHATSAITNTTNTGSYVIQNLEFDAYGHVTGITSKQVNNEWDLAHTLNQNGFQKMSNGLIFQWAYLTAGSTTYNFPIAFASQCFSIHLTTKRSSSGSLGFNHANNVTTTSYYAVIDATNGWMFAIGV
jgi:hypothetical protein